MVVGAEERLYTVPEVAERLRVSPHTVYAWLRAGRLKGIRLGGTRAGYRIRQSELERFLEEAERAEE